MEASLKATGVVNECYILQSKLGEDSFSELWCATSIFSATQFLLRFIKDSSSEEGLAAFYSKAMVSYSIRNPAVMDFIELERNKGELYLASEYSGQSLFRDFLQEKPDFPIEHICQFIVELAKGLDPFHRANIVYGALNPESIWIKVLNGVVQEIKLGNPGYLSLKGFLSTTDADSILENQAYMAPEVKGAAEFPLGHYSDIYSLGIICFKLITGLLPFRRQSIDRALNKSVSLRHVSNALARRLVPPELMVIVVRSLRKNPGLRYKSVLELMSDLKQFLKARRMEQIRSGYIDPLSELEMLNRNNEGIDARQFERSLDTKDYFNALANKYAPGENRVEARFPRVDMSRSAEVEKIELEEVTGPEDDDKMSAEEYVRQGIEAARKAGFDKTPETKPDKAAHAARVELSREKEQAAEIEKPEIEGKASEEIAELAPARSGEPEGPIAHEENSLLDLSRHPRDPNRWHRDLLPTRKALELLRSGFEAAGRGHGFFRFIEEGERPLAMSELSDFIKGLSKEGLLVLVRGGKDLAKASVFYKALRESLATATTMLSTRERKRIATKAGIGGAKGILGSAPLGTLLFGADEEAVKEGSIYSNREAIEATARAVCGWGKKSRPLILVIRDCQLADEDVHAFLMELDIQAKKTPACVFAFYKLAKVAPWHALFALGESSASVKIAASSGKALPKKKDQAKKGHA